MRYFRKILPFLINRKDYLADLPFLEWSLWEKRSKREMAETSRIVMFIIILSLVSFGPVLESSKVDFQDPELLRYGIIACFALLFFLSFWIEFFRRNIYSILSLLLYVATGFTLLLVYLNKMNPISISIFIPTTMLVASFLSKFKEVVLFLGAAILASVILAMVVPDPDVSPIFFLMISISFLLTMGSVLFLKLLNGYRLESLKANYAALLAATPDLMIRLDQRGTVVDSSRNLHPIFTETDGPILGQGLELSLPESAATQFLKENESALMQQSTRAFEFALQRDEKRFVYEARIFPYKPEESICFIRDITSRSKMEIIVQESQRKIKELYDRLMEDLETARYTQRSLVSMDFPISVDYKISSFYRPMERVGGDLISYCERDDGCIDLIFADVAGHGLSGAMVSGMTVLAFQMVAPYCLSPAHGLYQIHKILSGIVKESHISGVYASYWPKQRRLDYSYAGHAPILKISPDGSMESLSGRGSLILMSETPVFRDYSAYLEPMDKVLFFSDGMYELFDQNNNFLGIRSFRDIVTKFRHYDGENFLNRIAETSLGHTKRNDLQDDMTMLLLETFIHS